MITGGWWYKNPGNSSGIWTRNEIGSPLNNMATVFDFDGDNDMDILGSAGIGSTANDTFVWASNNGSGQFTILGNISSGDGDYLQGVAVDRFQNGELAVALSWHQANKGIQQFKVPADPANQTCPWLQMSPISQDEALSSGDIDKDGDVDLLLGTKWLRNEGAGWTAFDLHTTNDMPDRNRLADINGDGQLDAVVGYEAISMPGKLAWYEQGTVATATWTEHIVANPAIIAPMSLDVADMDGDSDIDIVVGEHNMANPNSASLYVFENVDGKGDSWAQHIVYTGDEHHDGAQVVDLDRDGDLDIVSIGWTHDYVLFYENKALDGSGITFDLIVNEVGQGAVKVDPDQASYHYGDVVTITATAAPGWTFSEWNGDLIGSNNPVQLIMGANKVVTATFVSLTTYTLTVNEVGNGTVTVNPKKPQYDYGEEVMLTAVADPGWTFSNWSGDLTSTANPVKITIDGDKVVTAAFTQDEYSLTINIGGQGSVKVDPDQATYHYGDVVTMTATTTPGWAFSGWSGDLSGSNNPIQLTMDVNKMVMATFTQDEYSLTVNIEGQGSMDVVPDQATYHYGDVVTMTATADLGWAFDDWSGDVVSTTNPVQLTMDGGKVVTATITQDEYILTVNIDGQGLVEADPDQATYHFGDVMTMTAMADPGWTFDDWSGDLTSTVNPVQLTIDGNKVVTATFSQDEYTLTVNIEGQGSVEVVPDQATYQYGDVVTMTADPGWTFSDWSGDVVSTTNPVPLTMGGNKVVTATFTQDEYTLTVNIDGQGSVEVDPDKATYHFGDVVTLTAIADTGWIFFNWSGDATGTVNPTTHTMTGDAVVTAKFIEANFPVYFPVFMEP